MKSFKTFLLTLSIYPSCLQGVFPIQFGIPESKIVSTIPSKDRDFAFLIPGKLDTYIFNDEDTYRKDYARSYFAITTKKGGWDCLRHYEILANGCIPYFVDLDKCPANIMTFLPKELIRQAMNLDGVSLGKIDHAKFDKKKYFEILEQLLEHLRNHLTTKKIAQYLLKSVRYSGTGKILFLSNDVAPDYMRCLMLAGLKELYPDRIVDVPKIEHIYKNYRGNEKRLYGKGFTYTRIVDDVDVDRSNIENRIKNKEFDLIIYGSVHRGLRFHNTVIQNYPREKIIYICGEDSHHCEYMRKVSNLFLREF